MNEGKKFEQDFKNSVPEHYYLKRLNDNQGWNGNNERFTLSNPYDYILFNGSRLFCLELKSTKGKSLPFSRISEHQEKELFKVNLKKGIQAGIIINYRDYEKTYLIIIDDFLNFKIITGKKSISIDDCQNMVFSIIIKQEKKRTRYKYNIEEVF